MKVIIIGFAWYPTLQEKVLAISFDRGAKDSLPVCWHRAIDCGDRRTKPLLQHFLGDNNVTKDGVVRWCVKSAFEDIVDSVI